jgi:hypothetical protein
VTISNAMEMDNFAAGTSKAQNFFRKGKRKVEVDINAMYSSDVTLMTAAEGTTDQVLLAQCGSVEGSIVAIYAPAVEFEVPDDPDADETMEHSFKGVCKGTPATTKFTWRSRKRRRAITGRVETSPLAAGWARHAFGSCSHVRRPAYRRPRRPPRRQGHLDSSSTRPRHIDVGRRPLQGGRGGTEMPVKLTKNHPYTITVDGEPVRLAFKRMTVEEAEVFKAQFDAYNADRGKPTELMVSPTEVAPEYRAWLTANAAWLRETFEAYVTVAPGDLELDGRGIVGGLELFDALGAHHALRIEILSNLYLAQILTEEQKKTLLSQLASATGSPIALPSAESGVPLAPIADAAAPTASVPNEPVIAPAAESFGTTVPSCSEPVLSAS